MAYAVSVHDYVRDADTVCVEALPPEAATFWKAAQAQATEACAGRIAER